MSKREIAAAAAKKYVLSLDNATANPPADRFHSVITLITLGKAEEGENINREKFLQAILTEFFIEYTTSHTDTSKSGHRARTRRTSTPTAETTRRGRRRKTPDKRQGSKHR